MLGEKTPMSMQTISLLVCERTFYEKRDTSSTPESVSETAISIPVSFNSFN